MKKDRECELRTRLVAKERITLNEAMEFLDVSESTVRRLFARLEENGVAIRTHGGIQNVSNTLTMYSFEHVARTNVEQKSAIARQACSLLEDGDVIYCDSGTTVRCLCSEMVYYVSREHLQVKVYTNSLANLEILVPHMEVTLIGGTYRPNRKDFCGYLTEQAVQAVNFNKSFIGTDGFNSMQQLTTTDFETARVNELVIRQSQKSIVITDSSKFKKSTHVIFAHIPQIDMIVTDDAVSQENLESLRAQGVRVLCAVVPKRQ